MSIGYFQWTKIGCFRWTRSGCFRRTLTEQLITAQLTMNYAKYNVLFSEVLQVILLQEIYCRI